MTRYAVRRFYQALWRLLFSVTLLAGAIEFAILCDGWQGGEAPKNVIGEAIEWLVGEAPESFSGGADEERVSWWLATARSLVESLKVLGIAVLMTLGLGPALGILAARFRRVPVIEPLFSPLFLAAFWPGFWVACLVIWWLVEKWSQPAFAGSADGWGEWWRAFLVAAIIAPPAVAWQIRSIAGGIREAGKASHVMGALSRGQAGSRLFYRHVFSSALDPVTRSLDRVLPILLGSQVFVEWVFRFPGLGTLMVDCARDGHYPRLLSGGIAMSLLIVLARFAGEVIYGAADRRGREEAGLVAG